MVHTVGPVWNGGDQGESELLASCYQKSLALSEAHDLVSVAFPSISTGVFGYPADEASKVAFKTVVNWLSKQDLPREVTFCCFSSADTKRYNDLLDGLNH